jgi:hypothetical protein
MKILTGFYLNEENGQTFIVQDNRNSNLTILLPDFFDISRTVYAEEFEEDFIDMIFNGKVSRVGDL